MRKHFLFVIMAGLGVFRSKVWKIIASTNTQLNKLRYNHKMAIRFRTQNFRYRRIPE